MSLNTKPKMSTDKTIRLQRVNGKLYSEEPRRADPDRDRANYKRSNPFKRALIGLIVLAAIVIALWWGSHLSTGVSRIQQSVMQNGQKLATQHQQLFGLHAQLASLQHQFSAFSAWVHQSFANLATLVSQHKQS